MASINISIKKEAYDFLKSLKTKDKSFSEVILNFKKTRSDPMVFFGALNHIDWERREKRMKEFRENFNKRLRR